MSKLQQVSALAGVSKATVSRVINNSENVSQDARQKVLQAMKQLNFHIHDLKRTSESTAMIGIILPFGSTIRSHSFSIDILAGAEEKAFENDYMILVGNSDNKVKEHELVTQMINRDVEGLVIWSSNPEPDPPHLQFVEKSGVPFVMVDRKAGMEAHTVRGDHLLGSLNLIRHLISLGHRHIAIVSPSANPTYGERIRGYQLALMEHGIAPVDEHQVIAGETADLREALRRLLTGRPKLTALFVASPGLLMPVVGLLDEMGLRVPEDISIVTFDDTYTPLPDKYKQFFTSVIQSGKLIGSMAMELLFRQLRNPSPDKQEIVLPGSLHIRQSTGPAAAE